MRVAYVSRLARAVEELVERSAGAGKVRAEVSAEFDYDRITINTETFDPDSQVARSTQTTEESTKSREGSSTDQVGVTSNLPEGQAEGAAGTGSQTARTDSTTNFEISKTIKSQVREGGQVKRLSVAVLVDGNYENGNYTPRTPEQIEQLTRLVRSAVGFNSGRGDTLEVVNLRFADVAPKGGDEGSDLLLGFTRGELLRLGEVGILSIVGLLALLLVVRPLFARLFDTIKAGAAAGALPGTPGIAGRLTGPAGMAGAIAGPGGVMVGADGNIIAASDATEESMIDISSIEGRVKASSLKKIGEIVDKHPEEAVSIVRNWMYQES
jgi:flagellar M-ring protein FliF